MSSPRPESQEQDNEKRTQKTAQKKAAAPPAKQARLKDPAGGLTAAGRKAFAERDGSKLRPGVQGPADTPEKMKRKGAFLTRHFTHPRGPMLKDGEPTRLALSAHAWGEPVPKTMAAAQRLAAKGRKLLEQYHEAKGSDAEPKATAKPKAALKKATSAAAKKTVRTAPKR